MSLELLSTLFLLFAGAMAAAVVGVFSRFLSGRARLVAISAFLAWLLYAGALGYERVIGSRSPPGPVFLLAPVFIFMAVFLVRSKGVRAFAFRVPVALLIGLQVFRVFVEITLYGLHQMRLVPRMLTFEGANFDILVGLSAPLVAWLYASHRLSDAAVRAWCWAGIVLLANIILRNLLTFSGALKTEMPNTGIGLFPFTFIPGFLAPLALFLHVLLLRSLPRAIATRSS